MTKTTKVTRADAEQVLAAVHEAFAAYTQDIFFGPHGDCTIDGDHLHPSTGLPILRENWEGGYGGSVVPWAIIWEDGSPYEWCYQFPDGGTDQEHGFPVKAVKIPASVHVEPIMSFILGIYPRDW